MTRAAHVRQLASGEFAKSYIAHVRRSGEQQALCEHLLGVASIASDNADKLDLVMVGELLGILHDLGKYSSEFQTYIKSAVGLLNQDEDEDYVDAGARIETQMAWIFSLRSAWLQIACW